MMCPHGTNILDPSYWLGCEQCVKEMIEEDE